MRKLEFKYRNHNYLVKKDYRSKVLNPYKAGSETEQNTHSWITQLLVLQGRPLASSLTVGLW